MSWSNGYLAIPYADMGRDRAGCDCWGLARMVYAAELGITLPDYAGGYVSAEEQAEVAALIGQETTGSIWQTVETPMAFDLLLFRHGRHSSHVGIFVSGGHMLHMATDDQSKHERFDQGRWAPRLMGTFRHAQRRLKGAL